MIGDELRVDARQEFDPFPAYWYEATLVNGASSKPMGSVSISA